MFSYCAAICNNGTDRGKASSSKDEMMKRRNDGGADVSLADAAHDRGAARVAILANGFRALSMRYDSHRAFNTITIAINPASARLAISENVPCNGCEWKYRLRDFFACIMAIPITEWRQGFSCRRAHMCNTIVSERFSISLLK